MVVKAHVDMMSLNKPELNLLVPVHVILLIESQPIGKFIQMFNSTEVLVVGEHDQLSQAVDQKLSDASTIVLSAPIFATIFAKVFLKEACGIINTILVLMTLGGVLLVAKPAFLTGSSISTSHIVGSIIAFTACILDGLWFVANRKLQKTHFSVIIIVYSIVVIILDTVILAFLDGFNLRVCGNDGIYLVGVAFCGIGGQLLITAALKLENVGPISIARTIDIVLAFIFQVTTTGEKVTWSSVLGAIL
ncbi:solute carrier family 35 member G1-like, partial [Limulus polyphemus]|uniref:Solute carrier family 35 member G1-like n=1 Tax=Limulus polyphemus TaxID=6850 RepID=A0ABM1T6R6_LIMPO